MPSENAVRLSSAQKRDLLGMSAAAVITTALIAAPILLPALANSTTLTTIIAEAVPVPLLIQSISPSTFNARVTPAAVSPAPARRRERPMASPQVRLVSRPITSPPVLVAVSTTGSRPAKPLGKRIAGLFTGDGTYSVRPFPTISTERQ